MLENVYSIELLDFRHYLILDGVSDYTLGDVTDNTHTKKLKKKTMTNTK